MYEYKTPVGWEDTFFQYVVDAQSTPLSNGTDKMQVGVQLNDGEFFLRYWAGLPTIAEKLQIYDWLQRQFASGPMLLGNGSNAGYGQMVVLPEVRYPHNGNVRFDLYNIQQQVAGVDGALTVYASQMVFSGVRRREAPLLQSSQAQRYKEVRFSYPYTLTINNYASSGGALLPPIRIQIPITEYDFELRRIELGLQSQGQSSQFKMLLYNQDKRQVANLPVLSNLLCHLNPRIQTGAEPFASSGELGFWPCPPMPYRVNSVLQFDIFSLLFAPTVLPQTFQLLFDGVRRIPC